MIAAQKWRNTNDSAVYDDPKAYIVSLAALDLFILEERSQGDLDDVSSSSDYMLPSLMAVGIRTAELLCRLCPPRQSFYR